MRGFTAYAISLVFTLVYGYVAAYNRRAEKVMVPLLDILQSIPVLGFLPSLIIALVSIFPHSNIGLELAAVLMIFTGQAWNMTFSFYNSLKAIPTDLREAGKVYKLNWWRRFTKLEMPYSSIGLVCNSIDVDGRRMVLSHDQRSVRSGEPRFPASRHAWRMFLSMSTR